MLMIKDFVTGLQFLTRIHVWRETEWSADSFGRSVKFFPLIGAMVGGILYLSAWGSTYLPSHLGTALLLALSIFLTGGLSCDGFMDTMDGIFSGRSRERMLEIMKDSRVGANGATAFVLLMLLKWSALMDLPDGMLPQAAWLMPIAGLYAMTLGITCYPYARPEGIGKAFAQYAGRSSLLLSSAFAFALALPVGWKGVLAVAVAVIATLGAANYIRNCLGGLTGDTYGALCEIAELAVLLALVLIR